MTRLSEMTWFHYRNIRATQTKIIKFETNFWSKYLSYWNRGPFYGFQWYCNSTSSIYVHFFSSIEAGL